MAGLVSYASSEEEDEGTQAEVVEATSIEAENGHKEDVNGKEKTSLVGPVGLDAVALGPSLPPADAESLMTNHDTNPDETPQSPYSANRALVHDLTLPSIPNLDIPLSPPGSPPPATNKKIDQLLELKKKGVHMNAKLGESSAMKNPSLMDKLMAFVEIDEKSQYETTLSTDLWDPKGFPTWAYRDGLKKTRDRIAKEREAEKANGARGRIDFVPSAAPATAASTAMGGIARGEKRKSGWK